ncbi:MAG: AMP-binding protein, partial [SAR324 cluster bacterium]|nr:AMP-binding protein [SAR324 cluster bacterium]
IGGLKALYHFSPLEAETIVELVKKEKGTILLGTPTFFMNYLRRIPRENFASIRLAIAGAEKLRTRVAKAFNEAFGFTPLEGYGCSELSPVAMINLPDIREATRDQIGNKPGTVGHPIPGVAVKVVNPESREELAPGIMGLLLVKGPNVMNGYLKMPEKTAEVVWDGWYSTGDLATLDKDGFVTLHDRLARFSKIAGEMVPHGAVEDAIQKVLDEIEAICVVSSIADDRKGERLIVLHTKELDSKSLVKMLADSGLPNLWIPRSEDFFLVQNIPVLGSGKLDLQGIKKLAEELASTKQ